MYYLYPGGTAENGETPEEACIRKTHEELGLYIRKNRKADEVSGNPVQPKCIFAMLDRYRDDDFTSVKFLDLGNEIYVPFDNENRE